MGIDLSAAEFSGSRVRRLKIPINDCDSNAFLRR